MSITNIKYYESAFEKLTVRENDMLTKILNNNLLIRRINNTLLKMFVILQ